jgi:uncharacterized protein (DUF486 family)
VCEEDDEQNRWRSDDEDAPADRPAAAEKDEAGSAQWSVPQLKVLQECITLVVFTVVAFVLFRSPIRWNIGLAYLCIVAAVYFAFLPR